MYNNDRRKRKIVKKEGQTCDSRVYMRQWHARQRLDLQCGVAVESVGSSSILSNPLSYSFSSLSTPSANGSSYIYIHIIR